MQIYTTTTQVGDLVDIVTKFGKQLAEVRKIYDCGNAISVRTITGNVLSFSLRTNGKFQQVGYTSGYLDVPMHKFNLED